MPGSRKSPSVTDSRGSRRRFDVGSHWLLLLAAAFLAAPFALGVYVGLAAQATIDNLRAQNQQLALEGSAHREAAARVNGQLPTLLEKVEELAERIGMDQAARALVDSLPDDAMQTVPGRLDSDELDDVSAVFDSLRDLLESLEDTLQVVTLGVAHSEALAEATPAIWPADGWISAGYGYRDDPFTGQRDFHPAVDISTRKGQPVYATATGPRHAGVPERRVRQPRRDRSRIRTDDPLRPPVGVRRRHRRYGGPRGRDRLGWCDRSSDRAPRALRGPGQRARAQPAQAPGQSAFRRHRLGSFHQTGLRPEPPASACGDPCAPRRSHQGAPCAP